MEELDQTQMHAITSPHLINQRLRTMQTTKSSPHILVFSTLGSGSNEEDRIRTLLTRFSIEIFPFDRQHKIRSMCRLFKKVWRDKPDLVVMEGSGIAGGFPLIVFSAFRRLRFVFSSGDAIGPWVGTHSKWMGLPFTVYEKWLYRSCAGFIGWTPYLVGRAMSFGAPRAMTAAGWAPFPKTPDQLMDSRVRIRQKLNIPPDSIVIGIAGSMNWMDRYKFCYGSELVQAMLQLRRKDIFAILVGDGTGRPHLERMAGNLGGKTILFTGRVSQDEVPDYLSAMDIGSLPQSVDQTGAFRFTTKISEYLDCSLPMVTGHVPMGYDLDDGWIWRLPGNTPWSDEYVDSMAQFLENMSSNEIAKKRSCITAKSVLFDRTRQIDTTTAFIRDLLPLRFDSHFKTPELVSSCSSKPAKLKPKKLLSIGHSYVLRVNRELANEFQRQSAGRWVVTAVAPKAFNGKNDIRPLKYHSDQNELIRVEDVASRWTSHVHFFHYTSKLKAILREGFDLVHAWEEPYITAGLQIARATPQNTPLVFRTAQSLEKKYVAPFNWIEKYCVDRMNGWIFSGKLVEQNLLNRPGYASKPRCHAPLGFDPSTLYVDRALGKSVKQKLGWDESIPVIGYLGRFVVDKGIAVLIESLRQLQEPWRAMFVGNGPMLQDLEKLSLDFPGQVALCTSVAHADVVHYINAMDLMVAPSLTMPNWREQFGRMLVEAFACGIPVIGSDSGEIPFVIGDTGIVVPENNATKLTQAIVSLLNDCQAQKQFSEAGLERAHREFTWATIAKKTVDFFDELTE